MVNQRFIDLANRHKNPGLPAERERETPAQKGFSQNAAFPDDINSSVLFSYDGTHKDYFQELIAKSNERFKGTKAEILKGDRGEIGDMQILNRLGLVTTIHNSPELQKYNLWPITPSQSEHLLKKGKLPRPQSNWEHLALILYDRSDEGTNPREAQKLYDSLKKHRQDLGLSQSDLENKLMIVNAGLEKDNQGNYGVKPIVLPGVTQVYSHEVLDRVGQDSNFDEYGLTGGLPLIKQLDQGDRFIYLPDETKNIGLRALYRYWDLDLYARYGCLDDSDESGRVNFAPQGRTP